ncbi:TIGR02680 family protein [Bacillus lacus]|uniref:TIGR02680 family protein n=1 Tax=Metabacillus lacus TaxID=1983721 RepID=A0A7X2J2W8_9BACI|nr:TIGR02680 family protein [Metabacillus lacus]MRX74157.1 TIGR02680 family protein [Metabacillus lacus]
MKENQWVMNRAGLLNFWYYDDEVFSFSDGKLLLRGTNGSGKSVTMQSFLPVLLDGKKSPDRLDPFGSKARRMEDYLLGEKGIVDRDERTGYLFIEYKKQGKEQYVTTGIGMQAKRHKGIKSWYFLLTDNRRIGHDFQLAHDQRGDRVPLSAKELENRIGQGGYVVHTQREYMEHVNKYIFGFQSTEAYEDLIKLLIQLRSPKLSKDFKPTVIYEILESALPPLTDGELRHLSDTIENMDQVQQQLEQLEREHDSSMKLVRQYHLYNQFILTERAKQWQSSEKKLKAARNRIGELEAEDHNLQLHLRELEEKKVGSQQQKAIAEGEKDRLQSHEVWQLEKDKAKKQEALVTLQGEIDSLQTKWDLKKKLLNKELREREQVEEELNHQESEMSSLLEELQLDAGESAFEQHRANVNDFERHQHDSFDFSVWLKEAKGHENLLASLKELADQEQRLIEEHERLQRDSSEKKKKIDEMRKEQDHTEAWFTEQKHRLEDQVFTWIQQHPNLAFPNEQQQEIARALQGLYELNRFDDIRGKLLSSISDYEAKVKADRAIAMEKKEMKQLEIDGAEKELLHWKTLKIPNPDRAHGTVEFRGQLDREAVAHIPFYAAVEFYDHVTDAQKERLEAALKHIGLLDSLITGEPVNPKHDRIIVPEPLVLGHTLADYLYPDLDESSPISNTRVDEVLRSIPLENEGGGFYIDADGTYSVGCLLGHAPEEGPSKYIGRSSRKRYQQEKIEESRLKLELLQGELEKIRIQLIQLDEELEHAAAWRRQVPSDQDLAELWQQIQEYQQRIKHLQEVLQELDNRWKDIYRQLQQVKVRIHQEGSTLNLSLTREGISKALGAVNTYVEHLHQLQKESQACFFSRKQIRDLEERVQERETELDEIKGEQNVKSSRLFRTKGEIESIEQQLKLKGIDEVRARIREVQELLRESEETLEYVMGEIPAQKSARENCAEKLREARISFEFWSNMAAEWERIVKEESARGFIELEAVEPDAIVSQLEAAVSAYDRAKLNEQLTKVFLNEQLNLTEYRMFEFTEESPVPQWFFIDRGDYYEPFKREWEQMKGRRVIQMEYQGQRVSPYFVLACLKKELVEQKGWLDEQDRQLYEDIIVNTVGVILRNRIQRADKWVSDMNKIMESRDNSSGLLFSISWKPLTAESEQELDTKELVQLLQRNSKFLNEDDLNRITRHFQSRIEKAKELIQIRNEGSTLHQVLKEVLDYRKWFTFVLSFRRVNEPKRELTNNAFFKFSGGEKAMAMYIPLFTAAYSRYKEAGKMAPYIISLDEAFAGVDENNIRDMFEVVEQLGFSYIMNSQALWGDYDSISSLSICELVRQKNADFVTVIRYQWDGKQRSLVLDEETARELVASD